MRLELAVPRGLPNKTLYNRLYIGYYKWIMSEVDQRIPTHEERLIVGSG